MKKLTAQERLNNIMNAIADSAEAMSDEELLAEAREDGVDVEVMAEHVRNVLLNAFDRFDQRVKWVAEGRRLAARRRARRRARR